MTHGKMILSAAALVVTAVGSFAFNSAKTTRHALYTTITTGANKCKVARCFTLASGVQQHKCIVTNTKFYTDKGTCANQWGGNTTKTL